MNVKYFHVQAKTYIHSLFVDFNAFFASVEQELRPELRGRPVVVVPLLADTTCCIAASYEAKPFGIRTGTKVRDARQLCAELIVIEARAEHYVRFHKKLHEVIEDCGVTAEVESIDEVHCPLWGEWMEVSAAQQLAERIKAAIATEVGPRLTCSIGLAPNRFLSKTASDMQKPNGLVTILPGDLPGCLFGLKLRDLYGIGPRMELRLTRRGITTVEQLCTAPPRTLREIWGGIEGERFYGALHGKPTVHRPTQRRTLGHSHILPPELRNERGARSVLHRLTQKAAMRLRSIGHVTGGMGVFVRCRREEDWSDEIRFAPTQGTLELLHTLELLWERRPRRVCEAPFGVGMNFFHLEDERATEAPLFDRAEHGRHRALQEAVDKINLDRGKNTVYFGGAHGAVGYTPMRIAFTRIPDPDTER